MNDVLNYLIKDYPNKIFCTLNNGIVIRLGTVKYNNIKKDKISYGRIKVDIYETNKDAVDSIIGFFTYTDRDYWLYYDILGKFKSMELNGTIIDVDNKSEYDIKEYFSLENDCILEKIDEKFAN